MTSRGTEDERTVMEYQLEAQRDALAALLDDLTEEEARARLVPSLTTLLGLVSHATFVEQVWLHHRVAGMSREQVGIPESVDESFALAPEGTVSRVRQQYLDACGRSRKIAAGHAFDEVFDWRGSPVTLRFIYAHLLTELARHAGQGDILLEQLQARREVRSSGSPNLYGPPVLPSTRWIRFYHRCEQRAMSFFPEATRQLAVVSREWPPPDRRPVRRRATQQPAAAGRRPGDHDRRTQQ